MEIDSIEEDFPFLTCLRQGENEFICIVQNADDKFITFYDYQLISTRDERQLFLKFGEIWWWESNRTIPINIFMRGQMEQFRGCLRTANMKDIEIIFGPITSLSDIIQKRIKRRQVQLVRKV